MFPLSAEEDILKLECNTNEYPPDPAINQKVSHWHGDITRLEIDAITNATVHTHMLRYQPDGPPGTVRYAMEVAAGPLFTQECRKLKDSVPGDAMVTFGYNLPAKCEPYIIIILFNNIIMTLLFLVNL